jgi:transcriptional regulator with XRE-family HTH domain
MSLGGNIKKARIDKGWLQQDLQEATELSQAYLSKIECNKADPSISVVCKIAKALGVSIDGLAHDLLAATVPLPSSRKAVAISSGAVSSAVARAVCEDG